MNSFLVSVISGPSGSYIGQRGEDKMFKEQILPLFRGKIRDALENIQLNEDTLQEIRLRVNRPVIVIVDGTEVILKEVVESRDIKEILEGACGYSSYAYEEEIKKGYVTVPGGHRIGVAGRAVMEDGKIRTLKHISALNIRVAHSVTGCADKWKRYFYEEKKPCHVLIISPPGCGKTTLLRDAVRMISNGTEECPGVTVGVVDERSEIAGMYRGIQTHELGMRTDVLDACPKSLGMELLLRSMAPKVIAVDEIGVLDVHAIENALRGGCRVLATLHGETFDDFLQKPGFQTLVKERVFDRYIVLKRGDKPGKVQSIFGKHFETLWEENGCM